MRKWSAMVKIGGAAIGGFLIGALILTGVDLYIAGHGQQALGARRLLDADAVGVHLSLADGLAIGLAFIAALGAAIAVSRQRSP